MFTVFSLKIEIYLDFYNEKVFSTLLNPEPSYDRCNGFFVIAHKVLVWWEIKDIQIKFLSENLVMLIEV